MRIANYAALTAAVCLLIGFTGCRGREEKPVSDAASYATSASISDGTMGTGSSETASPSGSGDTAAIGSGTTRGTTVKSAETTTKSSASLTDPSFGTTNTGQLGVLLMNQPAHGSMVTTDKPTFTWLEASNAESYTVRLEIYGTGGKFTTVFEKTGIRGASFQSPISLQKNSTYRWRVTAVNRTGSLAGAGENDGEGNVFMSRIDPKEHPANRGLDFSFNGSVSKEVLCRYLSRSVIYADERTAERGLYFDEFLRFILNTGAKYIGRACCIWSPSAADVTLLEEKKKELARAHAIDPDVVFEACIFENITRSGVDGIAIPSWVFEAFGKPVEKRNFRYDSMIFQSGRFVNHWGTDASVPDMTRLETQMFFYYRARLFIDAGYEGLHMGQVHLIGAEDDAKYSCWTKVLGLIRSYAKSHARRRFVFINAHTHGITGSDGKLLFDFHAYPLRVAPAAGSTAHVPTPDNPQRVEFLQGYVDSIYGNSLGGVTHSGWSCSSLPYFVEVDNYWSGVYDGNTDKPVKDTHLCWGMDEISWFANQPANYRAEFLQYAYRWVRDLPDDGYFEMPGNRGASIRSAVDPTSFSLINYTANDTLFYNKGFSDEAAIRAAWVADQLGN